MAPDVFFLTVVDKVEALPKKVVLDRDPISIFSVLAERDVFLVDFEL